MKCKGHNKVEYSYSLISLLNDNSIANLNKVCKTNYTKSSIPKNTNVNWKDKPFEFWDKLVRNNKGSTNPNV